MQIEEAEGVILKEIGVHKIGGITLEAIMEEVRRRSKGKAGAIGCFIGVVRERGKKGGKVSFLEYEAYADVVERELKKIRDEVLEDFGLVELMIHHIIDRVPVGEDTIYIVASGEHRKEVIRALDEVIDRIKKEASIWKKEVTDKGAYWISG